MIDDDDDTTDERHAPLGDADPDTGTIDPPTFDEDMELASAAGLGPQHRPAPRMLEAPTRLERPSQPQPAQPPELPPPPRPKLRAISHMQPPEPSEVRAISMKTPSEGSPEKAPRQRPQVKLAAASSSRGRVAAPVGNLAPPLDPREARSRKVRDLIVWTSLVVMLASIVTLVIWLIAGP
ncbi:MAG: hypothetical protein SFX73_07490 [Kofleriaceae bacterium]|nr:hypothetical protein [Kofleriaceae bacterium]